MMYIGLSAATGIRTYDADHIRESIRTILTTPVGTRVMRRDFGSLLADLIDKPLTPKTRMQVLAATVIALARWEPRIELRQVQIEQEASKLTVVMTATRRDTGAAIKFQVPIR